jgi:prepilin-type N-terminal cleavage/methylation domain-containing protein
MTRQQSAGFTLMEILVAVAIIGILVAVGYPAYQNYVTRARVAEALEFADAARTRVDIALASGAQPAKDLLDSGGKQVDMMTALTWNPPKPGSTLAGYIVAEMNLPGLGPRTVLALEKRSNGDWHCVGAAPYAGAGQALEADKLPSSCRDGGGGGGGAMAKNAPPATSCPAGQTMTTATDSTGTSRQVCAPPPASVPAPSSPTPPASSSCPPGQESLTVGGSNICIPACPSGQVRDGTMKCCAASNLVSLNGRQFCNPNAAPSAAPAAAPAPGPAAPTATPAPAQQPGPQSQKPTMANNPCGPDGIWVPDTPEVKDKYGTTLRQADPDFSKGPVSGRCMDPGNRQGDYYADVQCRQCTGPAPICEQIHFPTTCKWPNNTCGTLITNRLDGTKTVIRGCANNEFVRRDWYLGTSDEDKCDVIKNNQHVAFQCSFACTTKDCNSGLRPPESSLWKPKK